MAFTRQSMQKATKFIAEDFVFYFYYVKAF